MGTGTVRVLGVSLEGIEADLVTVEARFESIQGQRPDIAFSGLPDSIIRESKSRLSSALNANGLRLPQGRLFVNLAPAGRPKRGETLDLPVALAAASACGHLAPGPLARTLFSGGLGIDGRLQDVPGGLSTAALAREARLTRVVVPPRTSQEAALLPRIDVRQARTLAQVVGWAAGGKELPVPRAVGPSSPPEDLHERRILTLQSIRGQTLAKRALVVAAAGGHGLLFLGPPGTGKSLLAKSLSPLLGPPTQSERITMTRILSSLGRWPGQLVGERPFRAPHHTTSFAGLVGGGNPPRPGEITLAHAGVLFLDELPEFSRRTLEALRQPLEEGSILLARAARSVEWPARFQLCAAMNPCPCGYRGHPSIPCPCSGREIRRYQGKISGPLMDRIDLRLRVACQGLELLAPTRAADTEARALAEALATARECRKRRGQDSKNASLSLEDCDRLAPMEAPIRRLLERASESYGLSTRAVLSVRRVARTLADLAGAERPEASHHAEALALRGEALGEESLR